MDDEDNEAVDFGGSAGNDDFGWSADGTDICSPGTRTSSRSPGPCCASGTGVSSSEPEKLHG
jgi:hypothetical protein